MGAQVFENMIRKGLVGEGLPEAEGTQDSQ